MKEPLIVLTDLTKSFDEEMVLNHINLTVYKKEFLTLLGPSGCGKTTTLRIIGGFTTPDCGKVEFDGKDITSLPPYKREVNTVFQKYALFPNMNVAENIAFGLRLQKKSNAEIEEKVKNMLSLVNLEGFEKRHIEQLSGGQQQRVAIARALVNEPKVLLLDEPLGALDLKLRKEMQIELKSIQQRLGITFIYVTHDQEEALSMSDSIAVMKDGVIQQYGTPEDIYNEPQNAFVADFIGESNIVPGRMDKDFEVMFENHTFTCVDPRFPESEAVDVVVRPEDIKMTTPSEGMLKGVVQSVVFKGVHFEMIVRVGDTEWMLHNTKSAAVGEEIGLNIYPDDIHIMRRIEA